MKKLLTVLLLIGILIECSGWTKSYTKRWLNTQVLQLLLLEKYIDRFPDSYYFQPYFDSSGNVSITPISQETLKLAKEIRSKVSLGPTVKK